MDADVVILFLLSIFVGGIVTGIAGFAFGLVVSGIWLHIITPLQVATLIIGYGLFVQGYGIWVLRRSLNWRHVWPLALGGMIGAPAGVWLLAYMNPSYLRLAVGVLLILYSLNGLLRPALKAVPANLPVELGVGFVNGVLGGMTGLAGVFVTIWCGMRGWSKDTQRAVYQPVILAAFIVAAISLAAHGHISAQTVKLYFAGWPVLGAGVLIGFKLYYWLDDITFRKIILVLLLISGLVLVIPELLFR